MQPENLGSPVVVSVRAEHHISAARVAARQLTQDLGFPHVTAAYVVTAVSELAANLFFHAVNGGTIEIVPVTRNGKRGIEVIAEDEGPGIADVKEALLDDFSTNGGLGGGLPGVVRLMDEFAITSAVGEGTRVVARKWLPCTSR